MKDNNFDNMYLVEETEFFSKWLYKLKNKRGVIK
jgi:hypothetical protein